MAERRRLVAVALLTGGILAASALAAHAQSSLGIGAAEPVIAPDPGPFAALLAWINQQQQDFYKLLTGALRDMRDNPSAGFLLAGLSFAYGIFHAAGPGHGKAVISSYMLANEVALRRGVMLSFISAFLQALTAIVVIGAIFLFLRGTAVNQTNAVWTLEVMSYALVTGFGFWLLVRKFLRMRRERTARPHALSAAIVEPAPVHAHEHGHEHSHDCGCGHDHDHHRHDHHDHGHGHVRHHHAAGEVCDECGHTHMPDPAQLSGDRFRWSDAWSAVIAVGLRPCSGALIVLTFAWLNGMVWGGIASVFAMALGTAITVSAMATLAVTAKNAAMRLAGDGAAGMAVHNAIEIAGAATVFVLGLLLLFASLAA